MKFTVTSVLISGAAASSFQEKVASANAKIIDSQDLMAATVLEEYRSGVRSSSDSNIASQSLESAEGFLIREESGESTCTSPTLKLGSAMGYCHVNTTARDSYYYSCSSDGTDVTQTMYYCPSDMTCTTCNVGFTIATYAASVCTTTGAQVWSYYAGATCTSDDDPYDDYSDGWVTLEYNTNAECADGDDDYVRFFSYAPLNQCLTYLGNLKATSCSGTSLAYDSYSDSACTVQTATGGVYPLSTCGEENDNNGEGPYWETSQCANGSDDDDDDVCFHVDTKIDYKGVEYTYEELKAGKEPECTVPHTPASKGVIITTSCDKTVRVTDTHLMATTKGFQLAYSLKAGDVLYGDYDKEMCTVKSVEKEKTTQQYFGLNCVHSEVLASGLRASTFGDFHTLPSWYMTYVGGLVGTETASSLGEYIAEWYFQK